MTANAGYHVYNTGDVLTSAQVQYNLQNQTVMYFADTTTRDTALTGKVVEGMVSYTPATGLMYYNGTVWTAVSGGSVPTSYGFTAGKNKIINGDFGVWQRGTNIALSNGSYVYGADRWTTYSGFSAGSMSMSQQTFTPGSAPVAGYEGTYFGRINCASTCSFVQMEQRIEDVRSFAGQTVTFSFWAKASTSIVLTPGFYQDFGTGGSTGVNTNGTNITLTSSWTRYTSTVSLPSLSGKTIGTNSSLHTSFVYVSGVLNSATIDFWGVQVEASSTATSFQTATGTVQGELAACQRYYYRTTSGSAYGFFGAGFTNNGSSTTASVVVPLPVTMRIIPTAVDYSNVSVIDSGFGGSSCTLGLEPTETTINAVRLTATGSGLTGNRPTNIRANNNTAAYVGFTSEL
jgi:hypothetical protein